MASHGLVYSLRYSEPAGKLVELLLCARLIIEPDKLPSSSGYVSLDASANAIALLSKIYCTFTTMHLNIL